MGVNQILPSEFQKAVLDRLDKIAGLLEQRQPLPVEVKEVVPKTVKPRKPYTRKKKEG